MSYAPTTTQPQLWISAIGASPRIWVYYNSDAETSVDASGYFTDGYSLGMRDGDVLYYYKTDTKVWYAATVTVSGTTVDMANFTATTTANNTD